MQKEFETQRLVLRMSSPFLAGSVQDFYVRNELFFSENETQIANIASYSAQDFRQFLSADETTAKKGNSYRFWIFVKGSEKCIGTIALTGVIRGNMQACFINYKLDEKSQHKGYMIESAKFCVAYAFEKLGLHRIEADILPGNNASMRVVQKLGFKNDGIAEKLININGTWKDHVRMTLINPCI